MKRKRFEEPEDNSDRWLVSYADFITLIFAFFVMMYSVSSVQEKKLQALSQSVGLALGLNSTSNKIAEVDESIRLPQSPHLGVVVEPVRLTIFPIDLVPIPSMIELINQPELGHTNHSEPLNAIEPHEQQEHESLLKHKQAMSHIAQQLEQKLSSQISQGKIHIAQSNWGISIEINASLLFAPAEAQLSHESLDTLKSIADLLQQQEYLIRIEGHTDDKPIKTPNFPSNWELSSARATGVVRQLIGLGIESKRLSAVGYADTRSLADNKHAEGRNRNRRVQIMIFAEEASKSGTDSSLNTTVSP